MKKYIVNDWVDNRYNPFKEPVYPLWEAPVSQPLPTPDFQQPQDAGQIDRMQQNVPPAVDPNKGVQSEPQGVGNQKSQPEPKPAPERVPDTQNMGQEDGQPEIDFETEKMDYMDLALKQKYDEMMDKLLEMRNVKHLSPGQYKFIEDNIQVLSLGKDVEFSDLRKKVFKQIKDTFGHLGQPETGEEPEEGQNLPQDQFGGQPVDQDQGSQHNYIPNANNEPEGNPNQSQIAEPTATAGGAEFAHYDFSKNLKGIVFTEAPMMNMPAPGPDGQSMDPTMGMGTDPSQQMNQQANQATPPVPEQDPNQQPPAPEKQPQKPTQPDPKQNKSTQDPDVAALGDVPAGPESVSGIELCQILSNEIDQFTSVKNAVIKLPNFYSMKSDLFRKLLAAATNGIQIGSGGSSEDIFVPIGSHGVGIKICSRIYTDFGNIQLGKWSLQFDDPENYLSDPELKKFNDTGSPEEKEILRKRVVIESVAESFKDKIFIVMVVNPNTGEVNELGFNFTELLRAGWRDGYITVEFKANVGKGTAGVKVDGELIDLQIIQIDYIRQNSDRLDDQGLPLKEKIELISSKDGILFMTITGDDFKEFASSSKEGLFFTSKPFELGEQELHKIQRCIPDIKEILLKQC